MRSDPDFLAGVLDALSGFVYVYDLAEERIAFISRRWREEFGIGASVEEPPVSRIARLIHPDDLPALEAHHRDLRASPRDDCREVEYRLRCEDGRTLWVSAQDRPLTRDDSGSVRCIAGQARNITARKEAEAGRREVEARFRAVVENLPDAVFVVNPDTEVLLVNDAACSQLGYTREELCRQSLADFVAPEFGSRARERLAGQSGTATARESVHIRKDGTRVPVETVVVAVELDGRPAFIGVARDISDRERLQSQLRDAHRMESLGRLAAAVAHDFNNILAAIQGGASLLDQPGVGEDERRQLAAEVGTAASRGAELTRQLLTLGRRQPTDRHPLDLAQVVDEALVVLRRLLDPSIEIVAKLPDDCKVMADRGMMNQVVMNLALNARDAMPSGGRLTIAVAPSGPEQVELVVADTGMGIDESSLSRVFEPFFTTKGHGTGSGVGLATVHGIVAQHGGTISVQSTPGSGARFCVALPRSEESAARPSDELGEAGRARALTVLVVDDAAPVRRVIARMLRSGGHRALEAEHPEEALRLWEEAEKVDLVIADVTLSGGWDGPRLARELRDRDPDLSVVLVSGLAPDDRLPLQLPDSEFLQKPFTLAALNAVLARRFPA